MIDLEEFFSSKNKIKCDRGYGATSVITYRQIVTRINENDGQNSHLEEKALIIRDIFDLPEWFNDCKYPTIDRLSQSSQELIKDVIYIRYVNHHVGNRIMIFFGNKKTITTLQLKAIEYINMLIKNATKSISEPVEIHIDFDNEYLNETNTLDNIILPFLRKHVNDSFREIITDVYQIGKPLQKIDICKIEKSIKSLRKINVFVAK